MSLFNRIHYRNITITCRKHKFVLQKLTNKLI